MTGLGSIGGAATEEVHVTLGELVPGTTYYYRVTATNADGTAQGTDRTFTTPAYNNPIVQPFTLPLLATPRDRVPNGNQEHRHDDHHPEGVDERAEAGEGVEGVPQEAQGQAC